MNGCTLADARAFNEIDPRPAPSGHCGAFAQPIDMRLAFKLLELPGSAVLNNVGMYVGAGFVF